VLAALVEWRQIFADAWRFSRDYFYDPSMHGLDWKRVRDQYAALLPHAVTRWDVNFLIGELIGELNASHTYRSGGDLEAASQRPVGLLGVDWSLEHGAFRVARILRGAAWDTEVRSPLDEPGLQIADGTFVLAVNGSALDPARTPWESFAGLAGKTVRLTLNDKPSIEGGRNVVVQTLNGAEEQRLRHLAWVEANRRRVAEATDGKVGYIYVPDTTTYGQTELFRQFRAQIDRAGLVIDERFNSGGQLGDRFLELLGRRTFTHLAFRHGLDQPWPPVGHTGPQVMLINEWSGSGGDAFPWFFKTAGRGPIIGRRTWGGLIGPAIDHEFIDGGSLVVPPLPPVRARWKVVRRRAWRRSGHRGPRESHLAGPRHGRPIGAGHHGGLAPPAREAGSPHTPPRVRVPRLAEVAPEGRGPSRGAPTTTSHSGSGSPGIDGCPHAKPTQYPKRPRQSSDERAEPGDAIGH